MKRLLSLICVLCFPVLCLAESGWQGDSAIDLKTDTTYFNKNLSILDDNVQAALETLDEIDAGAPTTIDYLVGTASSDLSAEIAVGTTPGGQLGGSWASPTIDDLFLLNSGDTSTGALTVNDNDGVDNENMLTIGDNNDLDNLILWGRLGIGIASPLSPLHMVINSDWGEDGAVFLNATSDAIAFHAHSSDGGASTKPVLSIHGDNVLDKCIQVGMEGDTLRRLSITANGNIEFGAGGVTARDARIYRSGVSAFTIDTPAAGTAGLTITGNTILGNSTAATYTLTSLLSGATDPILTFANGKITASHDLEVLGDLYVTDVFITGVDGWIQATNTQDAASVLTAIFEGDRATPADNDEIYQSFKLSGDGGVQAEFARQTIKATDVNVGTSLDGQILWGVTTAGSLATRMTLDTALGLTTGMNFKIGTTQWNSGDSIDGTKVANADLGDLGVASGVWSVEDDSHAHVIANIDAFTSAALYGQISDETGSATGSPLAVFNQNPSIAGAVLTGTIDVGGGVLEIPNGSAVTDPAGVGQIAIDSTSGQYLYHDGTAQRVMSYKQRKCFGWFSPADADDDVEVWIFPYNATVTNVSCRVSGGTSLAVVGGDGTNNFESITCDADGATDDGSITNATFTSGEVFELDCGAPSGTVPVFTYCIDLTIDPD